MKLLHTSDWHLGHTLYGYDRIDEFRDFISCLEQIVKEERPDVMIIAGDIYHTNVPANSVQQFFTESLLRLQAACPAMYTIVCAGNHDSGSRLEINRSLWMQNRVHILGGIQRKGTILADGEIGYRYDLDRHRIEIHNPDGNLLAYVVALPYISPFNIPDLEGNTPREDRMRHLCQFLLDDVAARNTGNVPVVMTAHLALLGSNYECHQETGLLIGGEDCMDPGTMGHGYDYLALGHIHKAQTLKGSGGRIRYCGSPVPVSFDETQAHTVSIVEIGSHGDIPHIREREIPLSSRLLTIPAQPMEWEEAIRELEYLDPTITAYLRLNVLARDYLPSNAASQVVGKLQGSACRYCYIRLSRPDDSSVSERQAPGIGVSEFRELSPIDIAKMYYTQRYGGNMDEELSSLLETVWKEYQHQKGGLEMVEDKA